MHERGESDKSDNRSKFVISKAERAAAFLTMPAPTTLLDARDVVVNHKL